MTCFIVTAVQKDDLKPEVKFPQTFIIRPKITSDSFSTFHLNETPLYSTIFFLFSSALLNCRMFTH